MKKVLLISLAFPPVPMVGSLRIAKFCKYLPEMNWQPSVLTQKIGKFFDNLDWSPLEGVSSSIQIIRTPNFQPFYWWDHRAKNKIIKVAGKEGSPQINRVPGSPVPDFGLLRHIKQTLRQVLTIPDDRWTWIPQAFFQGFKHIAREGIDVIFSSSPSVTNHLLAYLLATTTGRPHVVDFRDLWTLNELYPLRGLPEILVRYDRLFEKLVLRHSQSVIVVNQTLKKQLIDLYPNICQTKIDVIYNGFDEDDLKGIDRAPKRNDHFRIVYAGSLYGHRNPNFLIQTITKWLRKNKDVRKKVKVEFYGGYIADYSDSVVDSGLEDIVSFKPRVNRKDMLQILFGADLLFLIHGFSPLSTSSTSTKLFEYLATGKPILGLMPEGEAAKILRRSGNNLVVSSPNSDKVIIFLEKMLNGWQSQKESQYLNNPIYQEFSRKSQAKELGAVLDRSISKLD
jgi:glycosyltransferase involved in cell wall biosynthesis